MTERPILFSGPMVKAILAGTKTQTRRAVKLLCADCIDEREDGRLWPWSPQADAWVPCPFGAPGDRLWVRETWCLAHPDYHDEAEGIRLGRPMKDGKWCHYAASDDVDWTDNKSAWRPSIHMPRWASRITLEVTGVRVERLRDISEADARAEGARCPAIPLYPEDCECLALPDEVEHRHHFRLLWESINGADSWANNPWVWVVAFRRVTP